MTRVVCGLFELYIIISTIVVIKPGGDESIFEQILQSIAILYY